MAESGTGTAAQTDAAPTAPSAPSQPSSQQFTVPAGKVLVDQGEVDNYRRHQEQIKTLRPFYDRATKLGFKSPEDFDGVEPLITTLRSRGLTPEQARRAFFDNIEEQGGGQGQQTQQPQFDPAELERKFESRLEERLALKDHESAVKAVPELLSGMAKEALGKGASDYEVKRFARELSAELERHRSENADKHMYPEGHPLRRSKWAPYSKETVADVVKSLKKERDDFEAASKLRKAEAVRTGTTTVAGPNAGGGTPEVNNTTRPGGKPSLDAVRAAAAAKIAARQRG